MPIALRPEVPAAGECGMNVSKVPESSWGKEGTCLLYALPLPYSYLESHRSSKPRLCVHDVRWVTLSSPYHMFRTRLASKHKESTIVKVGHFITLASHCAS